MCFYDGFVNSFFGLFLLFLFFSVNYLFQFLVCIENFHQHTELKREQNYALSSSTEMKNVSLKMFYCFCVHEMSGRGIRSNVLIFTIWTIYSLFCYTAPAATSTKGEEYYSGCSDGEDCSITCSSTCQYK